MPILFIDSGGVVEATYRDNQTSSAAGTVRTFSSMAIGPASGGRYVVACLAWSGGGVALTSPTIGGVAATVIAASVAVGTSSSMTAIIIAPVPTGTTATVEFNAAGATDAACVTYSVLGISSTAAADSATDGAANPTGSLSCQAGGAMIGCATSVHNPRRTAVWTGIGEDIETAGYGFSATRAFTAAHTNFETAQSSLACTCTFSGASTGGSVGAFVAFNPS